MFVGRFILFLFIATPAMLESGKAPDEVNLCTLVSDWQRFSGEMVRVKAVFREGAEQNALFDPGCREGVPLVYVSPLPQVAGKKRRLRRILGKDGQAQVVLEGVFRGPELAPVDPGLSESMKEKLKGSRMRYGHLGSFDMMIEVTRVDEAERFASK